MSFEMDFLPASHRVECERQRNRRWSGLMLFVVLGGLVLTEVALRLRLGRLREHHVLLQHQTDLAAQRRAEIDVVQQQHQDAIQDLAKWAPPLKAERASVVVDGILAARLPSMVLDRIEWSSGELLDANANSTLNITGKTSRLQELSEFIRIVEEGGGPWLEVRRSGARMGSTESEYQEFVLESVLGRKTHP